MIDPPASENVDAADPGGTDVSVCVVVVVVNPGGGVAVDVTGTVIVVVVTTVGDCCAAGPDVVVTADVAWPLVEEFDGLPDELVGCVGESATDVVGILQVVMAPRTAGDEEAVGVTPGAGITGSGGEAIALVTAPTPTQLTAVAVAVATTQAAIGSGVTRRMQ